MSTPAPTPDFKSTFLFKLMRHARHLEIRQTVISRYCKQLSHILDKDVKLPTKKASGWSRGKLGEHLQKQWDEACSLSDEIKDQCNPYYYDEATMAEQYKEDPEFEEQLEALEKMFEKPDEEINAVFSALQNDIVKLTELSSTPVVVTKDEVTDQLEEEPLWLRRDVIGIATQDMKPGEDMTGTITNDLNWRPADADEEPLTPKLPDLD